MKIKKTNLQNRRMISYGKYLLRIFLLTGKDSLFPVKSYNIKVYGPMISAIWKDQATFVEISYVSLFPHEPCPILKLDLPSENRFWISCLNQKKLLIMLGDEHEIFWPILVALLT